MLGVEPDERMARIARRHGVRSELASFEAWEARARTFGLLTAGHAWHWVDPAIGLTKAAEVLRPGATAALFWNYHAVDASVLEAFDEAYAMHAPNLDAIGHDASGLVDTDPFAGNEHFTASGARTYRGRRELSAAEWTAMLATFSDHQRLGRDRLCRLQEAVRAAIISSGGRFGASAALTYGRRGEPDSCRPHLVTPTPAAPGGTGACPAS